MSDIPFYNMDETGSVVLVKVLKNSDIMRCPGIILLPSHYREDGSCRHDEIICEYEGCEDLKFEEEIYCEFHCGY